MPTQFYINSPKSQGKEMAFLLNEFKRTGLNFYDKIVILRGDKIDESSIKKGKYWKYKKFRNNLICSSFHLNEETLSSYLAEIKRFKPSYLMAYPSTLTTLCRLIKNSNQNKIEGLKAVICSSENVYDWQRTLVLEVLGVKIFSHYGHSEKAVFAGECEVSHNLHFSPFYGFTQFINKENNICSVDGETGEIVVTGFYQNDFPFIKYKTNDRVAYSANNCLCKRNYLIAKKIIGREQEFVVDKNGNHKTFIFNDAIFWKFLDRISAYQYEQIEKGILIIKIEAIKGLLSPEDIEIIKSECAKYFIHFTFIIKIVDKIERTSSGKFKYLIQHLILQK